MVYRGYLPIWVFKSASDKWIVRLYETLHPYIKKRRTVNSEYAYYFEWLQMRIKAKYGYTHQVKLNKGEWFKRLNNDLEEFNKPMIYFYYHLNYL